MSTCRASRVTSAGDHQLPLRAAVQHPATTYRAGASRFYPAKPSLTWESILESPAKAPGTRPAELRVLSVTTVCIAARASRCACSRFSRAFRRLMAFCFCRHREPQAHEW